MGGGTYALFLAIYYLPNFLYSINMTKHTAIIFLSIFVIFVALGGFPGWVRTGLLVLSGLSIGLIAYFSSVVYCSNCKKLIDDAEHALDEEETEADKSANIPLA